MNEGVSTDEETTMGGQYSAPNHPDKSPTAPLEQQYETESIVLDPEKVDTTKVSEIEDLLSPEILKENRKYSHGMNVVGEGETPDLVSPDVIEEVLNNPRKALADFLTGNTRSDPSSRAAEAERIHNLSDQEVQIEIQRYVEALSTSGSPTEQTDPDKVAETSTADDSLRSKLQAAIEHINAQRRAIHREETRQIDDERLGIKALKLHMNLSAFRRDLIERLMRTPQPTQEQLRSLAYVREQIARGRRVTIALGPGSSEYTTRTGETVVNRGLYVPASEPRGQSPQDEASSPEPSTPPSIEGPTVFRLPTAQEDLEGYSQYCAYVARHCPGADLDIWIEPNHNLDDNGRNSYQHNVDENRHGEFCADGRNAEQYAHLLIASSAAIREATRDQSPPARIGMNVAFVDADFVTRVIDAIGEAGIDPRSVIDYITINPYRFGEGIPEQAGPSWDESLPSFRGPEAPQQGRFGDRAYQRYEEEILAFYRSVSQRGIRDIRTGESGWPTADADPTIPLTEQSILNQEQRADFNIRGWVLNRFLGLPESPWLLKQRGSKFAFIDESGLETPTFRAYENFNSLFPPSVIPIGEISTGSDFRQCRVFRDESTGDMIYAIWDTPDHYRINRGEERPLQADRQIAITLPEDSQVDYFEITTELSKEPPTRERKKGDDRKFTLNPAKGPVFVRVRSARKDPAK